MKRGGGKGGPTSSFDMAGFRSLRNHHVVATWAPSMAVVCRVMGGVCVISSAYLAELRTLGTTRDLAAGGGGEVLHMCHSH